MFIAKCAKKIKSISTLLVVCSIALGIAGCATKAISPADEIKLVQVNYSDLNKRYKKLIVGQQAPLFTLPDADGKQVSLNTLTQNKAVLLVFYRGDWCPYCIDQLGTIAAVLPEIEAQGVQVVAITPDKQASMQNTRRRIGQQFIFLSDPNAKVIKEYGVARANNLPHPAVYLLKQGGDLVWFYASTDYKKRPNGEQLLSVIKSRLK